MCYNMRKRGGGSEVLMPTAALFSKEVCETMKKLIAAVLSVALLAVSAFAFAACGKGFSNVKVFDATEFELTSEGYAFCVNKNQTELLASANELLDEITADGTLDDIINSFFDGTSEFTYTNPAGGPPTNHDEYLVVATNAEFPPFEYTSGNAFTGIDIQIASLLAEKLDKTLYVADMAFDSVIVTVQTGTTAHIGMAGITVNDERKQQVDFTDVYYESAQVLITREDDTLFTDCKNADDIIAVLQAQEESFIVGAQNGTTGYMYSAGDDGFGYDGFTNLTTKGYTAGALAVQDLANGRINAVIIDKQPALMIAESVNK